MPAPKRKFHNIDVALPDGEIIRLGTYKAKDGTVTVKMRLPGEWSATHLFRGVKNATMSVFMIERK